MNASALIDLAAMSRKAQMLHCLALASLPSLTRQDQAQMLESLLSMQAYDRMLWDVTRVHLDTLARARDELAWLDDTLSHNVRLKLPAGEICKSLGAIQGWVKEAGLGINMVLSLSEP